MTSSSVAELAWQMVDPRGRCNRKGLLIVAGLLLSVEILSGLAVWMLGADLNGNAVLALKLIFLWTAICAGSKRLHDLDLRAWWMLAAIGIVTAWTVVLVVAIVVVFGLETIQPGATGYVVGLAGSILPIFAATLWLHFRKARPGMNRFGVEPRGLGFSGPLPNLQPLHDAIYRLQRLVMPAVA